ncbi:MAG: hypothetical protein CMN31_06645 [Sandaracinus sp.]|nr:hypothetical protein [Sandaracinus sp.]
MPGGDGAPVEGGGGALGGVPEGPARLGVGEQAAEPVHPGAGVAGGERHAGVEVGGQIGLPAHGREERGAPGGPGLDHL